MISDVATGSQALGLALRGLLRTFIFICISLVTINIGNISFGFSMLPLAALYLWPFRAHYVWSMWSVLLAGLFQDMVSGGPLGMWALINCVLFLILDPTSNRSKPGLRRHWAGFAALLMMGLFMSFGLGRISLGQWPAFSSVFAHALMTLSIFPFVYSLDRLIGRLVFQTPALEA